ncbi:fatty acyl-CoA reductase 1-like isoform X1 [Leptidea sinapis]|uniref:fatty acyl-CoA reductase 1-like isoform X1 n=1 Tax=Leptidea sinapis TaxID=189913 RepID=UPI0021359080|nr:fatty acyl-CoA reductase 1-like isoform X1 [Leptidea sinapis]
MFCVLRCVTMSTSGKVYKQCRSYANSYSVPALPDEQYKKVADYYAGKSVLLTGATGFVGKVLLERLLYNCADIENVFVLIRPKKGLSAQKRLEQMTNAPIFTKLKQNSPTALKKIIPVAGDMTLPELGINPADRDTLVNNVSVVFHSAATVNFGDSLEKIIDNNIRGTIKLVNLSKTIRNLESFVYISSAYSNSDKEIIDEVVYPLTNKIEEIEKFCKEGSHDNMKAVKKIIGDKPNPYVWSKSYCETIVNNERKNMRTLIVRPSIVTPVIKEPLPGWTESWVAATGIFSNIAEGIMPAIFGHHLDNVCDMIPVDYVANFAIIVAAKNERSIETPVYNVCSSSSNPITWRNAAKMFCGATGTQSYDSRTRGPHKVTETDSKILFQTIIFLFQHMPALYRDIELLLKGNKTRYLKESLYALGQRAHLHSFKKTSWLIRSNKTQALIASLDEQDKTTFPCNAADINWDEYIPTYSEGVKKYLINKKYYEADLQSNTYATQ